MTQIVGVVAEFALVEIGNAVAALIVRATVMSAVVEVVAIAVIAHLEWCFRNSVATNGFDDARTGNASAKPRSDSTEVTVGMGVAVLIVKTGGHFGIVNALVIDIVTDGSTRADQAAFALDEVGLEAS
jgi:hypothetical protein